jgi:hypothetical protein
LQIKSKVPSIPRCSVEQLLLAIEAAPASSERRAKSACELPTKSPLPPIASTCNWSVDADRGSDSNEKTVDGNTERSSQQASGHSSQMSNGGQDHQHAADKEAEPIFMTEVG